MSKKTGVTVIPKFVKTFEASQYEFYEPIQDHSTSFITKKDHKVNYFHRYHRDSYGSEQMFHYDGFSESFKNQVLIKTDLFSLKRMFVHKVAAFINFQREITGLEVIVLVVPDLKQGTFNSSLKDIVSEAQQKSGVSSHSSSSVSLERITSLENIHSVQGTRSVDTLTESLRFNAEIDLSNKCVIVLSDIVTHGVTFESVRNVIYEGKNQPKVLCMLALCKTCLFKHKHECNEECS